MENQGVDCNCHFLYLILNHTFDLDHRLSKEKLIPAFLGAGNDMFVAHKRVSQLTEVFSFGMCDEDWRERIAGIKEFSRKNKNQREALLCPQCFQL